MNWFKRVFVCVLVCMASQSFADGIFGSFKGKATYETTEGIKEECTLIVEISREEDKLTIHLEADSPNSGFSQDSNFEIQGNALFHSGSQVGTMDDSGIALKDVDYDGDKWNAKITPTSTGAGISYGDEFCYTDEGVCEKIIGDINPAKSLSRSGSVKRVRGISSKN